MFEYVRVNFVPNVEKFKVGREKFLREIRLFLGNENVKHNTMLSNSCVIKCLLISRKH